MAEVLQPARSPVAAPARARLKRALRWVLGLVGWQVFRARGGVFVCPVPRASRARGAARGSPTRLHLGCGNVRLEGYVNVDIVPTPATDLTADIAQLSEFADCSVEEIRLEAVLEHLYRHQRKAALREWYRILQPGGWLIIAYVPDFDVLVDAYIHRRPGIDHEVFDLDEAYRYTHGDPAPWNAPEQIHKDLFTRESLARDLAEAGFEAAQIENVRYRDEPIALNLNVTARKPT
jgi:predicted SAM-dependent methyltransferase